MPLTMHSERLGILKRLSSNKVVIRTDGGEAIERLSEHAAERRAPDTRTAKDTTPVGDNNSSGSTGNASRFMDALTRHCSANCPITLIAASEGIGKHVIGVRRAAEPSSNATTCILANMGVRHARQQREAQKRENG